MQLLPTSKELYFLGICCFIQSGICSNIVWIFGASLGHSRDICSKIVTALKHVMDAAKLHSSIDLCSLSLSRFCTSANLGAKPLSIYNDVNHWCLILLIIIIANDCGSSLMTLVTMMTMIFTMMTMIFDIWQWPKRTWWPLPASFQLRGHCCRSTAESPCARSTPAHKFSLLNLFEISRLVHLHLADLMDRVSGVLGPCSWVQVLNNLREI